MSKNCCNLSFDWELEEENCNLSEDYTCEFSRLDSDKSVSSHVTSGSEKMVGSPLKNKGNVKIADQQMFLEFFSDKCCNEANNKSRKYTIGG